MKLATKKTVTSGSQSASTPSMAIRPPMTIEESRNSLAATGT
jgi:hypothetical protein